MASADRDTIVASTLDVYARNYVPQALKAVNENPAEVFASAPARWIDFQAYVLSFAGMSLLAARSGGEQPSQRLVQQPDRQHIVTTGTRPRVMSDNSTPDSLTGLVELKTLSEHNYERFFTDAVNIEQDALWSECEDHALYQVPILQASGVIDPRPSMYRYVWRRLCRFEPSTNKLLTLHVPGLREMSLRTEVGDIVQLRQLHFNQVGHLNHMSLLKNEKGRPLKQQILYERQYDSTVWGIDRLREVLTLRIDFLWPQSMLFNVCFTIQSARLHACYRAALAAQKTFEDSNDSWLRSMLFPKSTDGYYQKVLNKRTDDLDLYDPLLNYEQRKAVNTVLNEPYGSVPYIISGPPGTGKTKTLVELAMQLIPEQKRAHLLVCAPSDPAADTLIQRLSKHLRPTELLRLNAPSRSFPEVPDNVLPYCCVDDGMFSLPSFKELMKLRIVVTTCRDADILIQARVTNRDLHELEIGLHEAIHPNSSQKQPELHWTGLLIDEAAQATEPEALIPLSVVEPPNKHQFQDLQQPIFVMAGDQFQLGPRTASKTSALQTSLLERLLNRPFYRDHPLARSKQTGGVMKRLTQDMLPILRPAFTDLIRNYRSHPAILAIPSRLFYNDTLEPEAQDTDSLLPLPVWRGAGWPVLFVTNTAPDEVESDGGGWYNICEAQIACDYAKTLLQSGRLLPHEIVIMSPFQAQVKVLRKMARTPPFLMSGVNIGPLEAFQGLEARVVIVCTTRTRNRFLEQDVARGLGIIYEPKRFNVALTRAKQGLVVIGNPRVLERDGNWKAFMGFCWRNGVWNDRAQSEWVPKAEDEVGLQRLEAQLLRKNAVEEEHPQDLPVNGVRKLGFVEDEDAALWKSGNAIAEVIAAEEQEEG